MTDERFDGADLQAFRGTYRRALGREGGECPDPDRLLELVMGDLPVARRGLVSDHVISCRDCSADVRDLLDLHEATQHPGRARRQRKNSRPPWGLPLAAAAILIVGVGLIFMLQLDPGSPGAARGSRRGAVPVHPPEGIELVAAPEFLGWEPIPEASVYRVVLYDAESTPVWTSPSGPDTSAALPASVRARMVAGGHYYWRVFALIGLEERESGLHRFTIDP